MMLMLKDKTFLLFSEILIRLRERKSISFYESCDDVYRWVLGSRLGNRFLAIGLTSIRTEILRI